jgi:hypothetical protein
MGSRDSLAALLLLARNGRRIATPSASGIAFEFVATTKTGAPRICMDAASCGCVFLPGVGGLLCRLAFECNCHRSADAFRGELHVLASSRAMMRPRSMWLPRFEGISTTCPPIVVLISSYKGFHWTRAPSEAPFGDSQKKHLHFEAHRHKCSYVGTAAALQYRPPRTRTTCSDYRSRRLKLLFSHLTQTQSLASTAAGDPPRRVVTKVKFFSCGTHEGAHELLLHAVRSCSDGCVVLTKKPAIVRDCVSGQHRHWGAGRDHRSSMQSELQADDANTSKTQAPTCRNKRAYFSDGFTYSGKSI